MVDDILIVGAVNAGIKTVRGTLGQRSPGLRQG